MLRLKRLTLLAAITLTMLIPGTSALAGQPVTQTLNPPPPSFEPCKAVGSGTICFGSRTVVVNDDTGTVCGEGANAFDIVLDATVGQNAHAQAEIFREMVGVTGIVMTKLDGTANGVVLVSLAEKYGIPIHAIGIGETADDLRPFEARAYARSLVGLEP